MFDLIFDAVAAWNQIGLLLMASVFMLIGGAITGYELYWRLKAVKVKGRISGVQVKQSKFSNKKRAYEEPEEDIDIAESFKEEPVATSIGGLFALLFIGMPLLFAGIGVYFGYQYSNLTNNGEYADATVIRNDSSYDSESGTSYKAVLSFTDHHGKRWEVKDTISYGNSPSYKRGTKIGVYYDADDPETFVIHDFWHNMGIAIAFFAFGMAFIGFFALAAFFNKKKDDPQTSEKGPKEKFSGEMYYAVFEYQTPNGNRMEKVSDMGTSSLLNKMPGKSITLMMFPDNPEKIRRPALFLLIFGLIFLLPGIFIMNIAVTSFKFNVFTFLMIVGGLGLIAYKIWSFIQKIPAAEFKKGWADFKEKGMTVTSSSGGSGKGGRLLEQSEIMARVKVQAKHSMIAGYVMLVLALGLSVGAYYAGLDMLDMTQNGISASGEVVSIKSRYSSSSDSSGYTYYAVVKYTDINGRSVRFEDSVGSSHPMHERGDQVTVLYKEDKLEDAIIDRGIFNWGLSGGLALGVLLILWGAFHSLALARRYGGTRYRSRV